LYNIKKLTKNLKIKKTMANLDLEGLKNVVKELNEFLSLDPPVELNQDQKTLERAVILEQAPLFRSTDDGLIEDNTMSILKELAKKYSADIKKTLTSKEIEVLTGLSIIEGEIKKEEKESITTSTSDLLIDKINNATDIGILKEVVKSYSEFKSIQNQLDSYSEIDDLKNDLLDTLQDLEEKTEEKGKEEKKEDKKEEKKSPEFKQVDVIRELLSTKSSREDVIKELAEKLGKTLASANARLKLYEKKYGEMGKDDKKVKNNK